MNELALGWKKTETRAVMGCIMRSLDERCHGPEVEPENKAGARVNPATGSCRAT